MKSLINYLKVILVLILFSTGSIFCQETEPTEKAKKKPKQQFFRLTERDVILPITSIEWGEPDRWSFTARYIHMFGHTKNKEVWKNNLGISISPGWSGGRAGIDYIGIYSPENLSGEFALFTQFRAVVLRTWGNPLTAAPDNTYAGAELKICVSWLLDLGVGYYYPVSDTKIDPFFGFHIGVGI
ncbi:MAG: hypothetical protein KAS62_08895 [Candidatus Delongbacteria bacterium]|nr:hypothetical protein [Candidatus Delongbacteria bacterium]